MMIDIRPYCSSDETAVIELWQQCHLVTSTNNPQLDIERKCQVNPEFFLVAAVAEHIVGTCMAGYEGHRGWINYLAVAPDYQRQGIARQLMQAAEDKLQSLGCPKINLQVRETNMQVIAFYEALGYTQDAVVSLGKRLSHDPEYQHTVDTYSNPT
jgi:ribosomal protein S18 acetylase RimI-like enzyme